MTRFEKTTRSLCTAFLLASLIGCADARPKALVILKKPSTEAIGTQGIETKSFRVIDAIGEPAGGLKDDDFTVIDAIPERGGTLLLRNGGKLVIEAGPDGNAAMEHAPDGSVKGPWIVPDVRFRPKADKIEPKSENDAVLRIEPPAGKSVPPKWIETANGKDERPRLSSIPSCAPLENDDAPSIDSLCADERPFSSGAKLPPVGKMRFLRADLASGRRMIVPLPEGIAEVAGIDADGRKWRFIIIQAPEGDR
jgi:hypothetical protein